MSQMSKTTKPAKFTLAVWEDAAGWRGHPTHILPRKSKVALCGSNLGTSRPRLVHWATSDGKHGVCARCADLYHAQQQAGR